MTKHFGGLKLQKTFLYDREKLSYMCKRLSLDAKCGYILVYFINYDYIQLYFGNRNSASLLVIAVFCIIGLL